MARQRAEVYRPDVAVTLNNLGNVQRDLADLESARASYEEAIAIRRELARRRTEVYRPDVAGTLNNLGNVQRALADLESARASYEEATGLFAEDARARPTDRLSERQTCLGNLGDLYLHDAPALGWPDLVEARQAFRQARDCAEQFRGRFTDPRERGRVQAEAMGVYDRLLGTCVKLWDVSSQAGALEEAVEVAEASRARNLMELLADEALRPANAPPGLVEEFRQWRRRLQQAMRRLREAESAEGSGSGPEAGREEGLGGWMRGGGGAGRRGCAGASYAANPERV